MQMSSFPLILGEKQIGEAYAVSPQEMSDTTETWGQLAPFAQSSLNRIAFLLVKSGRCVSPQLSFPVKPLSKLAKYIGPDRSQIHGCFSLSKVPTSFRALWEHDSTYIKSVNIECNKYLQPKAGSGQQSQKLWDSGNAQLMLAERIRLNTNKLIAVYLSKPALSNVWWPVRLNEIKNTKEEQVEQIQLLWLNSTFGLMCILSLRQDTEGPWIGLKKETWGHIPLLNIAKLTDNQIQSLDELYPEFSNKEVPAIPYQINEAAKKQGWRYELDQKLVTIVSGKPKDLTHIYEMLAREPYYFIEAIGLMISFVINKPYGLKNIF